MGILDEAIREHLELKRQHGADDSELKQLEDQAFGPPERPGEDDGSDLEEGPADAAAEAPTEFMTQPEPQQAPAARRETVADIQEPPPEPVEEPGEPVGEAEDPPSQEEQPAVEHEAIPAPAEHSTEERHAIADQPTEMYDVDEALASTEAAAPPDEDLIAEEAGEARLGPAEPAVPEAAPARGDQAEEEDEGDDFFDEQRLSDELDQALEAPVEPAPGEHEAPIEQAGEQAADEPEAPRAEQADGEEDVLEETPDFLEEAPEDDQLWFEQKPPKDFDFDD